MKGYRFYEEFSSNSDKRNRRTERHVVAVMLDKQNRPFWNGHTYDAIASVGNEPNGSVASTGVSPDFLREKCRRVSEKEARQIHPRLFAWLDVP